ncbi:helix-turn-helix domain-containing protein [Nocardia carnea]|nr:helix-turn-helix transcriptional regulator [Nocardia carnea]
MEPGAGAILRAARQSSGISLRELGRRTHYSASYLSLIESGKRAVPPGVVAAYERVLGADLGRITSVAKAPATVNAAALQEVSGVLGSLRRVEDATGALTVLPTVRGLADMVSHSPTALASEIVQYRGWLEHAVGADATARRTLGTAVKIARAAGDPDRLAHSLGFLGYVTTSTGNFGAVLNLYDAALSVRGAHPVIDAYGRMRRAEMLAEMNEERKATRALLPDSPNADPPDSMYWWSPGFAAVQRAGVLARLGHPAEAVREAEAGLAEMPEEHRRTEWLASALRRVDPDISPT